MPRFTVALLAAPILLLVGSCTSGGGGPSLLNFLYSTDWTGATTPQSQVVRLINPSGGDVLLRSVDNNGGVAQVTFNSVPSGVYEIQVTQYSQPGGQGAVLGVLRDQAQVSRTSNSYQTVAQGAVDHVRVVPATATIQVQRSIQLYATARTAADVATFTPPGSFVWQALNDRVSVNSDGIVVGQLQGTGIVRATETTSGQFNSAVITVEAANTTTTKWTIMVFMNAANDLDQFSDLNVNQMERVANNPDVRFVVQWKRVQALGFGAPWTGTRRYLVEYDNSSGNGWNDVRSELIQDMGTSVDMGNKDTLRQFASWVQTYYPAQRYVLVIWNHGSGWRLRDPNIGGTRGVSFDDEFFTYIRTYELAQALDTPDRLDVVSWDASLMQMIEVAYEIKDRCDYVVGSEESPPGEGLPYDLVFGPLRTDPDQSTESMLEHFGTGMLQFYGETRKITQSSVRTSALPGLATALSGLGQALLNNQGTYNNEIIAARQQAQSYSPTSLRVYRDLRHLTTILSGLINNAEIDNACTNVISAFDAAIVHNVHNSLSPNSFGLSVEFGPGTQPYWTEYGLLSLSGATVWDDWLEVSP
ncbi:MAG: hypothetical protein HND42_12680 [Armatimonadetes bacterium]|nr:hypothetical protein [Armatimonadota bacterium]